MSRYSVNVIADGKWKIKGKQMKGEILIADDELHIRQLVNSTLGRDYSILEASNGEEAINIARRQKPDLILLDIIMPKVDGFAACSLIKTDKATKGIPVVMLTGIGYEPNKKLAKGLGANGYITKPFNLGDLLNMVEQYVSATVSTAGRESGTEMAIRITCDWK